MKLGAALLFLLAVAVPSLRADPVLMAYYNGGDGATLAGAVETDYTHITVAFVLPDPGTNQLGYDAIGTTFYGNVVTSEIAQAIRSLQSEGKKVLLSFGGSTVTSAQYAALDANIPQLASNLAAFVKNPVAADGLPLHFDGLDIDWEDTAAFTNPGAAGYDGVQFLTDLTIELRLPANLPSSAGWLLTHAPQPPYLSSDPAQSGFGLGGYIPVLNAVADQIDWVNMQYYNNDAFNAPAAVVANYQDIVAGWENVPGVPDFAGLPASKLLVGKPIAPGDAGSGWYPAAIIADEIVKPLSGQYGAEFGGVFGWQLTTDADGKWAATMESALAVPEPSALALAAVAVMLFAWLKFRSPTRAVFTATPPTAPPAPRSRRTHPPTTSAKARRSAPPISAAPRSAPAW